MIGVISNIQRFSIHDGPGIRITVFMQGCPLDCWWCHNPENKPYCKPEEKDTNIRMTPDQLLSEIKKEMIFIEESNGGVTFSGGEPFMQADFLNKILDLCKKKNIHTAVDTSGFVKTTILKKLIDQIDLFLFDIKFVNNDLHKKYTGESNTIILQNLKVLVDNDKEIIIRLPLIPKVNDSESNLNDIIRLMKQHNLKKINLLPFHRIAEGKYIKLNIENRMKGIQTYSDAELRNFKDYFSEAGLQQAKVGG